MKTLDLVGMSGILLHRTNYLYTKTSASIRVFLCVWVYFVEGGRMVE